jgi:hypothetical protein
MRRSAALAALTMLLQCFGCGQFFVLSSVTASPEGQTHVFSTKDVHACQVTETNEPVCTQVAKH